MHASLTAILVLLSTFLVQEVASISISDIYSRILEKERNVDDTFAFQFIRPIGSVAGELIWPRSYSEPSELVFDENGAAFNVRPRPSLSQIMRTRSRPYYSNAGTVNSNDLRRV